MNFLKNNGKTNTLINKDFFCKKQYPCPCCGYSTFPIPAEQAIAYICPVCFWENDLFIEDQKDPSDCNHGMTLEQAQKNYQQFFACSEEFICYVRKPKQLKLKK